MDQHIAATLRVGFVPGVTPDRWARGWAERMPRQQLELVPLGDRDGVALLHAGALQMCFVRQPVDRTGLHLIPLYDEQPVVVVSAEHPVAVYDEVDVADLAGEHLLQDPDDVPAWRDLATEVADGTRFPVPAMDLAQAVASVAADAGVLVLPMSLARLHHRRDVRSVPVTGVPTTSVGLAWPVPAPGDPPDHRVDAFIGVVRRRTVNSSRSGAPSTSPGGRPGDAPDPPSGSRGGSTRRSSSARRDQRPGKRGRR